MKNLENLIVTSTERYFEPKEAVEIGYLFKTHYDIPVSIKFTGKKRCCLQIGKKEMTLEEYEEMKKDFSMIDVSIYKTSEKHDRRIKRTQNNEDKLKLEAESNLQLIEKLQSYPKQLC